VGAAENPSDVLGAAHALLHLIDFDEPFGFSVAEAMACGTAVIAYDRGSMAELIDNGSTLFVVGGLEEAVGSVDLVSDLDRLAIRASIVSRFHATTMVDRYVDVYRALVGGATT
jgi:glycosyltransferase involved in cell wall biosynthesis